MKFKKKLFGIISFLLAFLLLFGLSGCDMINDLLKDEDNPSQSESSAPEVVEPVDPNWPVTAFGTEIKEKPGDIAVASPALAEYIFDMGLFDSILAVSDYCHFSGASELPSIGSVNLPDMNAIKEISPKYILTFAPYEESVLVTLQQMNIDVIVINAPKSLDSLKELYRQIALFFCGNEEGTLFGDSYVAEYEAAVNSITYSGEKAKVGFLRAFNSTVITGDTMENELFTLVGFINVASEERGYAFPEEKLSEFDPSVLFVNNSIHIIDLETNELYKKKSAVKNDKIYGVDFDCVALCSRRSLSIVKDMLATVYSDYQGGTALSPAYPSKYTK